MQSDTNIHALNTPVLATDFQYKEVMPEGVSSHSESVYLELGCSLESCFYLSLLLLC